VVIVFVPISEILQQYLQIVVSLFLEIKIDLVNERAIRTLKGHTDMITSVAFSQDSRFALSGSKDKTIKLWEIEWEYE